MSSPKPASRPKTRPVQPTQDQPKTGPFQTLEDMILEQLEGEQDLEPVLVDSDTYENQDKFLSHDLTHSHLDDNYQMCYFKLVNRIIHLRENVLLIYINIIVPICNNRQWFNLKL